MKWVENTVGKGEIARYEQFLLFLQCFQKSTEQFLLFPQGFLPVRRTFFPFSSNLKLSSATSFSLEESKICRLGKGSDKLSYDIEQCLWHFDRSAMCKK